MPKGHKTRKTLAKEAAREAARQLITASMRPMIQSQIAHAIGIGHLYTRDKQGKFSRIESEDLIEQVLAQGREGKDYWIFAKDPSVQAFSDLMNRALDKPKEQPVELSVTDETARLAVLDEGRAKGYRILYREAHTLVEELADATLAGTRKAYLTDLTLVPLLIIDDLGMRSSRTPLPKISWS